MEEIRPMVKVISHTPNMETLIASAAKLCYSNSNIDDIYEHNKSNPTDNAEFINKLIDMGHESPLEHATITFGIENVSRALLAQITRHRIATFSVQSQRYVKNTKKEYYTPEEITNNKLAKYIYDECVNNCFDKYNDIVNLLIKDGLTEKEAIENARCVLPNASLTKLLMTMNIRSLHNFFKLRTCKRAQKEIRDLALEMLRLSRAIAPSLFINAGAPCMYGNCDQGKMTCKKPYEKYNPNNQDSCCVNSDTVDKSLFTKDNFNPYGVSIVNLSGANAVSEKISKPLGAIIQTIEPLDIRYNKGKNEYNDDLLYRQVKEQCSIVIPTIRYNSIPVDNTNEDAIRNCRDNMIIRRINNTLEYISRSFGLNSIEFVLFANDRDIDLIKDYITWHHKEGEKCGGVIMNSSHGTVRLFNKTIAVTASSKVIMPNQFKLLPLLGFYDFDSRFENMSKLITELNNRTQSKSSIPFDCSPVNDFYPELISTEESLGNKLKIYNDVIDSFSTIFGKNPTDINNQKWIIKNLSEKIIEELKNIKKNEPLYHKVKSEDRGRDHSEAIFSWLYMDTDSIIANMLSHNKNSNHQNIDDEKSESNFERDKNKLLDEIAFGFGEDD